MARPICFMLFVHWARRAASRAAWTAGNSRAINTAMIAITTSSSIKVKPRRLKLIRKLPESRTAERERPPRHDACGTAHARHRSLGEKPHRLGPKRRED